MNSTTAAQQYVQKMAQAPGNNLLKIGDGISCEVPFPTGWNLPAEAEPHYVDLVNRSGLEKDGYIQFSDVMKKKHGARALHFIALPEALSYETILQIRMYLEAQGLDIPSLKEAMYGYHTFIKGTKHPYILTMNEVTETIPVEGGSSRSGYILLPPSYQYNAKMKNFTIGFPKHPCDKTNTVIMAVKL